MSDEISNVHSIPFTRDADTHGKAAVLLVESLLHGLIEKKVLSVAEAVEIVDVATEVRTESGIELDEPPATLRASIKLLHDIGASLRFDLAEASVQPGTPI